MDTSPPQKKSAMAELLGETFASKDMDSMTPADIIKEEVASYLGASGITVDGDPLTWWKSNECKYPHSAKMLFRCARLFSSFRESVLNSRGHSDCKEVHTLPRQCRHPCLFEK